MSENNGENPDRVEAEGHKAGISRREFLKGGLRLGILGYGLKEAPGLFKRSRSGTNATQQVEQAESTDKMFDTYQPVPASKIEEKSTEHSHVEPTYYDSLTPEQQKLVDETAIHLTTVYSSLMSEEFYPTEADKVAFFKALTETGLQLNPNNPNLGNQLAAVIALESGFSPAIESGNGSGGIGLIQFSHSAPENLGTTPEALSIMSPTEQLSFVLSYFESQRAHFGGEYNSLSDVYMAVFAPQAINAEDDHILYEPGSEESNRNLVLDNQGGNRDGVITKREATMAIANYALEQGEKEEYLL